MSKLTSPSKIRQFMLDYAKNSRAHKFTRVSQQALDAIEAATRNACINYVKAAPSKGQTL